VKKYLPLIALVMATSVNAADEPAEANVAQNNAPIASTAQGVVLPSLQLDEQAEMLAQRQMDDAVQRMNDEISREMDQQLSESYAFSD